MHASVERREPPPEAAGPHVRAPSLERRQFRFTSSELSEPLSTTLSFEANGRIGGYGHANEHAWHWDDDRLVIRARDGRISCIAERVPGDPRRLEYAGRFLLFGEALHRFTAVDEDVDGEPPGVHSFDLFDTLVFRKCGEPRGVFDAMEAALRVPGFAELRMGAEQLLWRTGDYDFDDIYRQLAVDTGWADDIVAALQQLELDLEWQNLCPITEVVQRVRPGDLVVSDMYLPIAFIRRVVSEKCGLAADTPIYLSSHGKNRGTIWGEIAKRHAVRRHHGDNLHGDIRMVQQAGLVAEHVGVSTRTVGERLLAMLGMKRAADLIREVRLTYFDPDPALHGACMAQLDVNLPLLIVASLSVLRTCADRGYDTALMCSRDCNLWVHLLAQIAGHAAAPPTVTYYTASRILYLCGGARYRRYFDQASGTRNLLVDVSGTGRSPAHFIASEGLQDRCGIYLLANSSIVGNFMDTLAPARGDVELEHLTRETPFIARISVESMNMSLECRTIGFEDVAGELVPEVEPPEFTGVAAEMISHMRQIFGITLGAFESLGPDDFAFDASAADLRRAAELLSLQAITYHGVLMPIIGTVCHEETHVRDVILERGEQLPAWN